jgi:hypothetical protein
VIPSRCGINAIIAGGLFDSNHIGPWTGWQGNLHSDLMVVGQDWGGTVYFVKHKGIEDDDNPTNGRLCFLLNSIGIKIDLPRQSRGVGTAFFTNAVLCAKPGGLTGSVMSKCFENCGSASLRPQIETVNPRVVDESKGTKLKLLSRNWGRRLASHYRP